MSSSPLVFDLDNPTLPDSLFAGKYRVEKVLGQGGMGMVLAARHLGLDEPVAIKVLLPAMILVPGMVERFTREARASAKIKNEHVVRVTDVDALPSGVPYMVMERLDGTDLSDLHKSLGPLPVIDAIRYLIETCSAIGEAHAMGIIHRDLKPANLFLARRRDGTTTIKVLDFGISKAMQSLGEQTMTVAVTVLGSPSYMSPEQIAAARDLDGRTDIWSLGVILYQLLTSKVPFPATGLTELCALVLQTEPRRPSELRPDLPPGLESVILRCLEKDRTRRFGTAGDLVAALLPFASSAPTPSASSPSIQTTTSPTFSTAPLRASPPALDESAAVTSVVTSQQVQKPSSARIVGLLVALGLLALGGSCFFVLRSQHPMSPASSVSPSLTAATNTAIEASPTSTPSGAISPEAGLLAASSASAEATEAPMGSATDSPMPTPPTVTSAVSPQPAANTARPTPPTIRRVVGPQSGSSPPAPKNKPVDVGF